MSTTLLAHPEYSSGLKSYPSPAKSGSTDGQKAKHASKYSTANNSNKEHAPRTLEERSLFVGLFNDVLKTVSKILTGSLLTDVLKGLLKDGKQTWQEIIYRSCMDSLPSRFFTDVINSFSVRFFNGNHSFLGFFKLPTIPPEVSSQLFAIPLVTLFRAATASFNVNKNSAQGNMSPQEAEILEAIVKQNGWFYQAAKKAKTIFNAHFKPQLDKFLGFTLGVHAGKPLADKEGNFILNDKGDKQYSNPHINTLHLGGIMAGTFLGSFFLPRHTQAFGFEKATNVFRGLAAVGFTSLCRLNTTLIHNGVGMHFAAGSNFDKCFRTSVVEKMLVPFTQYFCNFLGAMLSTVVPMNGAVLSTVLTFLTEIPATFLSSGLVNVAKQDRMSDEWTHLAQNIWKPIADSIEKSTKIIFKPIAKFYGYTLGMFDPRIKNMYDVDIANPDPKPPMNNNLPSGFVANLGLFAKKCAQIVLKDIPDLKTKCLEDAKTREDEVDAKIAAANEAIDLRKGAESALAKLNIPDKASIKIDAKNKDFNRNLILLAQNPTATVDLTKLGITQSKLQAA